MCVSVCVCARAKGHQLAYLEIRRCAVCVLGIESHQPGALGGRQIDLWRVCGVCVESVCV